MNLENELNIIQELLKIPISKIEINGTQIIKIYSSNIYVGDIKYYIVDDVFKYETTPNVVNYLKWDLIYSQNKSEIDKKINTLFENQTLSISLGTFRNLYVKVNGNDEINFIHCEYSTEWKIEKVK